MSEKDNTTDFSDLVTVEIRYRNPQVQHANLIWGINGWQTIPIHLQPENTLPGESHAMNTAMTREKDTFVVRLQVPRGAELDYGFRTTDSWEVITSQNGAVQIWTDGPEKSQTGDAENKINHFIKKLTSKKRNYTRFIVLGMGRTGSSLLISLLNSHPNIRAFKELYHNEPLARIRNKKTPGVLNPKDNSIRYLENKVFKRYPSHIQAVGFKFLYQHARHNWSETWNYIKDTGISVVHIKRRNYLDRYLSENLAFRTNQWSSLQQDKDNDYNKPIALNPKACLKDMRNYHNNILQAERFFINNPMIDVYYQDLVSDQENEIRRILDFLQVPYHKLTTDYEKQRILTKKQILSNCAEIEAFFKEQIVDDMIQKEWIDFLDEDV